MKLKATEVFVPGAYPTHTYVKRSAEGLEKSLKNALETPGQIVSLSGPSKAGKTVLVERVVGPDYLITISGASLRQHEDVWNRALDWMDIPSSVSVSRGYGGKVETEINAKGEIGVPFLAKGEAGSKVSGEFSGTKTTQENVPRTGLQQVVKEIANSEFVIFLDDFHYMDRLLQIEVAKTLKEAVRLGVKIVTASVSHRGDDVVRANPELRGRVHAINLEYWNSAELKQIAKAGFDTLQVDFDAGAIQSFADESAGSPQLMQSLCLQACFVLDLTSASDRLMNISVDTATLHKIYEQASATTDYRSLVDVLEAGPRTRGTERKTYKFQDHSEGDVYRAVLKAVAHNPPLLSFPYETILTRISRICMDDTPVGSSLVGTCSHMTKLALDKFPTERAIDWDDQKQVFDIPDPYLLFYLRWSGRLKE
jgi:hypothetical protein